MPIGPKPNQPRPCSYNPIEFRREITPKKSNRSLFLRSAPRRRRTPKGGQGDRVKPKERRGAGGLDSRFDLSGSAGGGGSQDEDDQGREGHEPDGCLPEGAPQEGAQKGTEKSYPSPDYLRLSRVSFLMFFFMNSPIS